MRILFLAVILLVSNPSDAQWFRASVEPHVGLHYYKSIRKVYEFDPYHGLEGRYGLKAYAHFGNHLSLSAGMGGMNGVGNGDLFAQATLRCFFFKNYQTGFSAFVESGLEFTDWGDDGIPFYLGTQQKLGNGIYLNFRMRLPTFMDVKYFYDLNHFKTGVELGLQFDLIKMRPPDPLTRNGNPFILM